MVSVSQAVYRLKRVPPRRIAGLVGRYALRSARSRARRWHLQRNRGELSDMELRRALRGVQSDVAFARFVERFFVQPEAARTTAKAIAARHPELAARTHDKAQEALDHIVDLLGSGPTQLGERIDWQCDFKTGFTWPIDVLGYDQDGLRLGNPCDVKVPWELSRCHHWVTLGRA